MGKTIQQAHKANAGVSWLALFTSLGTLLCCALPIVFVSLGFGATVAALTSIFPVLIILSEYKTWVFGVSGTMLVISWLLLRWTGHACPTDPQIALACQKIARWNWRILYGAAVIWIVGFIAAYLSLPIRLWLDNN